MIVAERTRGSGEEERGGAVGSRKEQRGSGGRMGGAEGVGEAEAERGVTMDTFSSSFQQIKNRSKKKMTTLTASLCSNLLQPQISESIHGTASGTDLKPPASSHTFRRNIHSNEKYLPQSNLYMMDKVDNNLEHESDSEDLVNVQMVESNDSTSLSVSNRNNFYRNVAGVELSPDCPRAIWPNGVETILPYILDENGMNKLQQDAQWVLDMSKNVKLVNDCPWIVKFSSVGLKKSEIATAVRKHLAHGNVVIIGDLPIEPVELNLQSLREELSLLPERPLSVHDMVKRDKEPREPHIRESLKDFVEKIEHHEKVRFVLDLALQENQLPDFMTHLDDATLAWNGLKETYNPDHIPLNISHARSWGLLHYGGSYTYPHHDASGFGTIVVARSGLKIWSVMRPEGYQSMKTRLEIDKAIKDLFDEKGDIKWVEYAIYADAGDIIIQPPGQWHQVYTPIRSVTTGGHFISYDTLHLMEQSMRIDFRIKSQLTNSDYDIYSTLAMLTIQLPFLKNRSFYWKPMMALALMILRPDKYTNKEKWKGEDNFGHAKKIGKHLQKSLLLNRSPPRDYLFFETSNWMDPGPVFDIYTCLQGFR
ncbi:hypothetical protein F5887DRAFT_1286509 [Amanita rubescens]|nr:hypothetical protein F5887DRAFT_1286509 [Amanita rubescens]